MAVLSSLRTFINPNKRFMKTSDESLLQYTLLMYGELRDKSLKAATSEESMWYSDLAALLLELGCRYDENKPRQPGEPSNPSGR